MYQQKEKTKDPESLYRAASNKAGKNTVRFGFADKRLNNTDALQRMIRKNENSFSEQNNKLFGAVNDTKFPVIQLKLSKDLTKEETRGFAKNQYQHLKLANQSTMERAGEWNWFSEKWNRESKFVNKIIEVQSSEERKSIEDLSGQHFFSKKYQEVTAGNSDGYGNLRKSGDEMQSIIGSDGSQALDKAEVLGANVYGNSNNSGDQWTTISIGIAKIIKGQYETYRKNKDEDPENENDTFEDHMKALGSDFVEFIQSVIWSAAGVKIGAGPIGSFTALLVSSISPLGVISLTMLVPLIKFLAMQYLDYDKKLLMSEEKIGGDIEMNNMGDHQNQLRAGLLQNNNQ